MNTLPDLAPPRRAVLMERHDDVALGELLRYGDVINRFAMQKTERRIGLRVFGRWIGFETATSQRQIETLQLAPGRPETQTITLAAPQDMSRWRTPATLALAALVSAATTMLLRNPPLAPDREDAMIVRTLKPPLPLVIAPDPDAGRPAAIQATPPAVRPAAPLNPAVVAPPAEKPADGPALTADPDIPQQTTLRQARALALSTNEPAYWAEGARSGVVVVGPERSDNGRLCRNIVVFTRVNLDPGASETSYFCRP